MLLTAAELAVDHEPNRPSLLNGPPSTVRLAEKYVFCRAEDGELSWATPDRRREDERKPRAAEGRCGRARRRKHREQSSNEGSRAGPGLNREERRGIMVGVAWRGGVECVDCRMHPLSMTAEEREISPADGRDQQCSDFLFYFSDDFTIASTLQRSTDRHSLPRSPAVHHGRPSEECH